MSNDLTLEETDERTLAVRLAGDEYPLFNYVWRPDTAANEAPRPYVHPLRARTGDVLTNHRPNDHPWHHALSLTITNVDGVNFWGGPTHAAADGYQWRDDHGAQVHRAWTTRRGDLLEHTLDWREARSGRVLLHERRRLQTTIDGDRAWTLRWTSELVNVAGRDLSLGNYHSMGGLAGSHYTGLQFRGARALLDDHGDPTIGLRGAGGKDGEAALHGHQAEWMEWHAQHDTTLRRTRIRFAGRSGPVTWFVRRHYPVAAFAFHREEPRVLAGGQTLTLDHELTFISS